MSEKTNCVHFSNHLIETDEKIEEDVLVNSGCVIILHNDEVNTFDWVIKCLVDICKHTFEQAEQISLIVHFKGKCDVKHGSFEKLKPLCESLLEKGLSASIETL